MMSEKLKLKLAIKITNPSVQKVGPINLSNLSIPKPILKWVGGKSQILDKLIPFFPSEMDNYHEPFLGGGSVLFTLLSLIQHGYIKVHHNIYVYEINRPLIAVYQNIQHHHEELYACLQKYIAEYNDCDPKSTEVNRSPATLKEAKSSRESYYYWIRTMYNQLPPQEKTSVLGSSLFIFLNKTCFRGLFRMGPNGFNVPYGNYVNPQIIDHEHLVVVHNLIKNVQFMCQDFTVSLSSVGERDFVYLDPPYAPENSKSFVKYTDGGFTLADHQDLFTRLNRMKSHFLLSNADVELVHEHFNPMRFNIEHLVCKRAINSKNPSAKTNELLIRNYM
jgi:DNA adenine methylase